MKVKIYQINLDRDVDNAFRSYQFNVDFHGYNGNTSSSIYDLVYECEKEDTVGLEDLFSIFNRQHPEDYEGRSMSVSDVIALEKDNQTTYHYCDDVGWTEIEFNPTLCHTLC